MKKLGINPQISSAGFRRAQYICRLPFLASSVGSPGETLAAAGRAGLVSRSSATLEQVCYSRSDLLLPGWRLERGSPGSRRRPRHSWHFGAVPPSVPLPQPGRAAGRHTSWQQQRAPAQRQRLITPFETLGKQDLIG